MRSGHGKRFAVCRQSLPALGPGQSIELTFYSMVEGSESMPNGVIKGDK